jgi:hypothetical protein
MRAFRIYDFPLPDRLGSGLYQGWVERCRSVIAEPAWRADDVVERAILDVRLPSGADLDLLHLLTWVDRMVRDLALVPADYSFHEYGAAISPEIEKLLRDRTFRVTIHADIAAAPARAAKAQPEEEAACTSLAKAS